MTIEKSFQFGELGYRVELGKVARQADGAVWCQQGGTVVLATVVSSPSPDFPGFLPLTVDYRELMSAAGKIPGSFHRREGRASEREILIGRLVDRALRPLFPENYFDQVQIIITTYSVDKEHAPHNMALTAASLALLISKIPLLEPVGVAEVGRINGEWVFNPTFSQSLESDVRLIIAGTQEGIVMVEGASENLLEKDFVDVMFRAHELIKDSIAWQRSIQSEIGVPKQDVLDAYELNLWKERADQIFTNDAVIQLYKADKVERNIYIKELKAKFALQYQQEIEGRLIPEKVIDYALELVLRSRASDLIIASSKRVDGRSFDQVRPISIDVGLLPGVHGSALFTRGRTQALASATLGGGDDAQKIENIMLPKEDGSFMLHYNFLPFSTGEIRPMRGPGRRDVGHGNLAATAIRDVLPDKEAFPYTIRLVVDILESDGSSSMATVCSSVMALLQAGVPLTSMVSGIAMGLLLNNRGDFRVISDISGFEDQFGMMDFKVAGTDSGITAIQMDIKYKGGLKREVFEKALEQARQGRQHILSEMRKVLSKPNPLSDLVPKVVSFKISTEKIGGIIGTGGKTIREITETTGTSIDIEQDGLVKIFGGPDSQLDKAIHWVKTIAGLISAGDVYTGKIRRIVDFGVFVELVPGFDGLVHYSNMPREIQRSFGQELDVDQVVSVQVLDYDPSTGRVSLKLLTDK